jgi:archaellum component FlaF (FlaF/FlaG flagellin family)
MSNLQDLDFIKLWLDPKTGKTWFVNGNGQWQEYSLPSGGGGSEAGSGLTQDGSKIDLGGELTKDTEITSQLDNLGAPTHDFSIKAKNVDIESSTMNLVAKESNLTIESLAQQYAIMIKGNDSDIEISGENVYVNAPVFETESIQGTAIRSVEGEVEISSRENGIRIISYGHNNSDTFVSVNCNNKGALFLPETNNVDGINIVGNGAIVYDNENHLLKVYINGSWETLAIVP